MEIGLHAVEALICLPALLPGAAAQGRSHPRGGIDVLDIERLRRTLKAHAAIDGLAAMVVIQW